MKGYQNHTLAELFNKSNLLNEAWRRTALTATSVMSGKKMLVVLSYEESFEPSPQLSAHVPVFDFFINLRTNQ